ncbi:SRPBCC family protein [Pseudarthrobacter sp. DSP2-3-2b1]|uniref:SRPBCC family protein n=1 Tax=Pseudarthrobacter sp. DSP2-3-2b1 TaxID=2804661 RepID=UPI003CFB0B5A
MGALEYSEWIKASPEDVWRVYADPSRLPEWQTGSPVIVRIEGAGDQPGSIYTSTRGPGTARTTVLSADPPHRLVTRSVAYFGLTFDVDSRLLPERNGTLLRLRVETHWPRGLGLVGRLVERAILSGSEARKELANLKAIVEREAGKPPARRQH